MQVDLESRVIRSPELIEADVDGGLLMLSVERGKYFSLNPTAAAIWRRLEAPISVRELCDGVMDEFDVGSERAVPAVLAFVSRLIGENIVAVSPTTGRERNGIAQ